MQFLCSKDYCRFEGSGSTKRNWKSKEVQKRFFDWLGGHLGYKSMEDRYDISANNIYQNGGRGVLHYYSESPSIALQNIYPQHNWRLDKFRNKPTNKRNFFDLLYKQLGYKSMDDWYNVTVDKIHKSGGVALLLQRYNNSPSKALMDIYPEHNWQLWKFKMVPMGYWKTLKQKPQEISKVIDWLSEKLSINSLDDWYSVPLKQVQKWVNVSAKELGEMLQIIYPQHRWNNSLLDRTLHTKVSQRQLVLAVQQLFPNRGVIEEYKHLDVVHSTGLPMELDVYVEDLKLAFEYQGSQHHKPVHWMGNHETQKILDVEKQKACEKVAVQLMSDMV